jgi:S-adenosyl-L-methionine methyltransferase
MSRLDSHIRQKIAQRDYIDLAARCLAERPGIIVEFGLGQGRSYSHLFERFPRHEVVCFDRRDVTPPGWGPPPERLVLGELEEVLADPTVRRRFAGRVLLAHLDLGSGVLEDAQIHHVVAGRIHDWLAPGAWLLSDRPLVLDPAWRLHPLDGRDGVTHAERYFPYARQPD